MTQDEIISMAREAGIVSNAYDAGFMDIFTKKLKRFAALVAAHEREKQAEQEPFDMDDHPPHRLCECRNCMEYFTPLPDCDAFAAFGKPIAEQEPVAWIDLTEQDKWSAYCDHMPPTKNRKLVFDAGISAGIKFFKDKNASPVRTKDLTDDEIWEALHDKGLMEGIRAVIAADREKNRG